ncbi:MAG: type II toxin-antitoxin system VapC family toxin [Gemmatimonadaceae bacterium]
MILYAESSAVLAWLLDEPRAALAEWALRDASLVVTSTLTGAECSRAILRGAALGAIGRTRAQALVRSLEEWEAGSDRLEIGDRVLSRASAPFPCEPIRTLDAVHVASAALVQAELGAVTVLSFDDRVRSNAAALGMALLPPDGP